MDKMTGKNFGLITKEEAEGNQRPLKIYKETPENEVKRDPEEQKVLNKLNVKAAPRTLALKRFLY